MAKSNRQWRGRLSFLVIIAVTMIVVQLVNMISAGRLGLSFGLWPRHIRGLTGIVFAPWLHGSWTHLFANLPVLLILSALLMWDSVVHYVKTSLFIILGGGLLVWVFGRNSIHIGASGWLFGLWAYLLTRAFFQHSLRNIVISMGVLFFYGSLWWGLLPKDGVSVESHLAGALCGVLMAYFDRKKSIAYK